MNLIDKIHNCINFAKERKRDDLKSTQWAIYIKNDMTIEGTNEYGLPITDWQRS